MPSLTPTVNSTLPFRPADFETLHEGLDYAARGSTGCNFYSPRGELVSSLSYAELRDSAVDLARRFDKAGFARGARFAIMAETRSDFLRFFYACQYAGLIPVPLPLHMHMGGRDSYVMRLRGMLQGSGASYAVASSDLIDYLRDAATGLEITLGEPEAFYDLPAAGGDLRPLDKDGPCYIQYSSGSTSAPRGVLISQRALASNAHGIATDGLALRSGDRSASWLPLYHDMGLVGFCITPMLSQVSIDYVATASFARRPLIWLKILSENQGTISFSPTFGYELCVRRGLNGIGASLDLSRWRVAGIGGEMVRMESLSAFAETFAVTGFSERAFLPSYGLAESTLAVTFAPLDKGPTVDRIDRNHYALTGQAVPQAANASPPPRALRNFVYCGRALSGHEIEIRDKANRKLPDRRVGQVVVRGPSVMVGYYGDDESTARAMTADGWLNTGDLGYMVKGELVITGRSKDLIILNGRNIWPQDIEWAVEKLDSVRPGDVACFSVEDEDGLSEIIVVVESRLADQAAREVLVKAVSATVQQASGTACKVVVVPSRSLTFTSSGKLSRTAVKADYVAGIISEELFHRKQNDDSIARPALASARQDLSAAAK